MCKLINVSKSSTPARERVVERRFYDQENVRGQLLNVTAEDRETEAWVLTVVAEFEGEPTPGDILAAQAKVGLPFHRNLVYPGTVKVAEQGRFTSVTWKVRA